MSKIILVGVGDELEQRIRSSLGESNGAITVWDGPTEGTDAALKLVREDPAAVVLGPELGVDASQADPFSEKATEHAIALARELELIDPTITRVLFGSVEASNLRRAMAVGIRDVVAPDAKKGAIKQSMAGAIEAGIRIREIRQQHAAEPSSRFIVVVSAKGGAGKTIISSNLAAAIAQRSPRRTVLVDLQFGDAATALLLAPVYSMGDAVAVDAGIDIGTLKVFLTPHNPSGLNVLCAPDDPAVGEDLPVDRIGAILDLLAQEFGSVIVDTDPGLSEVTLAALERATDIVIVADLDVPSVRGTRKLIEALDIIGMGHARRHVLLNRANSKVGLSPSEVEEAIGVPIDVQLPSSRQVPLSMNEGRPLVLTERRSAFGNRINELAESFLPAEVRKGGRR